MVRFLFILPPLTRGYGTPKAPERVDFKIFRIYSWADTMGRSALLVVKWADKC